ncbi:type II secretion system secretin GspD [Solidesulfovibrio sp.]|uniref:type II secretion system secretin GspD n=1 Tax=Solidesulfovibrio sp. TaxID=2910990 RepID=UPI0026308D45|nr:type II secretion system secretin GspD [Solidesulfovibrio sp.]
MPRLPRPLGNILPCASRQAGGLRVLVLALWTLCLACPAAWAAPAQPEAPAGAAAPAGAKSISLNFDGVDLRAFIKYISQVTGKNFVVDDAVKGNVTVISPAPLTLEEVYKVFESVLEVNGFTALPTENFVKVVPAKTSRTRSMPVVDGREVVPSPNDHMITQVLNLNNVRSPEVRKVLAPLVSPDGLLADYADTNALIITDYRPNIQRIIGIVNQIDVASAKASLYMFPLKHASAAKLAQKIEKVLSQEARKEGGGAAKLNVVAEERTNSVIVMAEPQYVSQVKALLAKLDVPNQTEQGNLRVFKLQHADAENLSKVLNELFTKGATAASGDGKAQGAPTIAGGFNFVADKATNSLLVTAAPEDFGFVESVVKKLDAPRKQVYVEALIMEVSTDKSVSFGVNLNVANKQKALGDSKYGGLVYGSSNPAGYESLYNSSGAFVPPAGGSLGALAFPVKIGEVVYSNLQAMVSAAKSDNSFNIIATPQLMTLDNEEATITVAENRPYLTSQDVGQSTTDRPYQRFDYKDVGTTLKVTPQINEGNAIKLKIRQETSRIDETVTKETGTLQPTTRKRVTETTVMCHNGETIVLSGLIGKSRSEGNSKVPGLGDVPVVGWLFKNKSVVDDRTNLYVFITPRITSPGPDSDRLLHDKQMDIERQIEFGEAELVTPIRKAPVFFAAGGGRRP